LPAETTTERCQATGSWVWKGGTAGTGATGVWRSCDDVTSGFLPRTSSYALNCNTTTSKRIWCLCSCSALDAESASVA